MPVSVANAAPVGALPVIPIYAFTETRGCLVYENQYPSGESQSRPMVATSRMSWQIRSRMSATQFNTLKTFYDAHGESLPFTFTPLHDTTEYTARFAKPWQHTVAWAGRIEVQIELVQVS